MEMAINPLASCLPLVLQLPVFISLYFMLRKSLRSDICPAIQQKFQETYAQAHHLASVSRLRVGDAVCLFNGDGHEYRAVNKPEFEVAALSCACGCGHR